MVKNQYNVLLVFVVLGVALSGCATKAGPARIVGFIPAEQLSKPEDLPFHSAWRKPGVDWDRYTKIHVADINTDYLLETSEWAQEMDAEEFGEEAGKLASYTREEIIRSFQEDPENRFQVVENTGPDTLIAELALTEVVPSSRALGALGFAPYGVGTAIKVFKAAKDKRSYVAFEARVRDAETGEVLAMFADREAEKAAPLSFNDVTWYGHAHNIIDDWAEQFVEIANQDREAGEVVKDSRPFTLKPW